MANLRELTDHRMAIISKLLESQNIIQAVANDRPDFLTYPDPNIDINSLIKKGHENRRIFPYRYQSDTKEKKATFITMALGGDGAGREYRKNRLFKYNYIWIGVYTHEDLLETNEDCLRTDFIVAEIMNLVNEKKISDSVGALELVSDGDYSVLEGRWQGHQLWFRIMDINYSNCR